MTIKFTPEAIALHRERAAMAAMVDTDTFRAALEEIERLQTENDTMMEALVQYSVMPSVGILANITLAGLVVSHVRPPTPDISKVPPKLPEEWKE